MADGDKFLYMGALLYCDKGCLVLPFVALPKKHFLYGPNIGTTKDCVPILNIPSFGVCMVTRFACIPMVPQWEKYHDGALWIEKFRPLLVTSECCCKLGGIIRIFDTRMAAVNGLSKGPLAVVGNNLLKTIDREIGTALLPQPFKMLAQQTPIVSDIAEALGRGVRKGVVDTVVGLYELATTNPLETLGGLATIVGVAAVGYGQYANPVSAFLPNPAGDSAEERLANFDKTFGTNLSATHDGIKEAIAEKEKEFDEAGPLKKAEMVAEMSGYGGVIIADAIWGSKATSRISKIAKTSKLGRAAQASRFGQKLSSALTKASDIAEMMKQAAKAKAERVYKKLKEATKGIFRVKKRKKKTGKDRAAIYSSLWPKASLSDAIKKFAGNSPVIEETSSGKTLFKNPKTGIQVVYDKKGNYFRIEDTNWSGKAKYLDMDGNRPTNQVVNGKTKGRTPYEYQQVTHFQNIDK